VSPTNPIGPRDGEDNGSSLIGFYDAWKDLWCGPGLVENGRLLPKGGVRGSETRGKEVAPIRYRDMDENGAIKPLLKETRLGGTTMSK
jgi:hypothetical protein